MIDCMKDCKYAQCSAGCKHWQAQLATARQQLLEYEQTEAAVLPENVGIKEYVGSLKSQLATAQEEIETYKDALATKFNAELCEALKPLRLKIVTAKEENRWIPVAEFHGPPTQYMGLHMRPDSSKQPWFGMVTTWSKAEGFYLEDGKQVELTHIRPITLPKGE